MLDVLQNGVYFLFRFLIEPFYSLSLNKHFMKDFKKDFKNDVWLNLHKIMIRSKCIYLYYFAHQL